MRHEEPLFHLIAQVLRADAPHAPRRATLLFDVEGRCRHASENTLELLGISPEEARRHTFEELHAQESGYLPLRSPSLRDDAHPLSLRAPRLDASLDGRVRVELHPLFWPNAQEPDALCGVIAHYTPLATTLEAAPSALSSRWERILDSFPAGILLLALDGEVRFVNQSARQIQRSDGSWKHLAHATPYTIKSPRSEPLDEEHHPLSLALEHGSDILSETVLFCFEDGHVSRIEWTLLHLDSPDERGDDSLALVVLRDVSARHEREHRKGELLAIASHELRNPLTPLRGLLQLLEQHYRERDEPSVELLRKAQSQVERLVKLVEGLLDLSIVETGRFSYSKKPHDLRELIDELVADWCIRHGDERFELELPPEPLLLTIDASGIEQVLHNRLDNALKYNDPHHPVAIRLSVQEPYALLHVQDHGEGFPMEQVERLFDRFTQGRNLTQRHGSLGIGLYLCKRIVEEHAGTIEISSEPGQGTTVAVRLPLR